MTIAKYLWELGSLIILLLGTIHLYYTFFSDKFLTRDKSLKPAMEKSSPVLTKETTMWKAWIGFNASHSSGAMFIGIINLYLACYYFTIFQSAYFFFIFNMITIAFYVWLAKKYWFKVPFIGVSITLICFIVSFILVLAS
ncbi:MAG: hypothetical protein V4620_06055 [Bacteroidota bacterium]